MGNRPSWDHYFLELVTSIGRRGTCDRGQSGCLIVKDNHILCTGYAGAPSGFAHCSEEGHLMKELKHEDGRVSQHCMRTLHAEQNALLQAAKRGIAVEGATCYCTMEPCRTCAMMLINAGIERVVCLKKYHSAHETREMFFLAKITLEVSSNETMQYDQQ